MKLTTIMQVSVDGVMQGNGGLRVEDRRKGFERGGWARPLFDSEAMTFVDQLYQRADAFLFGRRTYEIFAGSWGVMRRCGQPHRRGAEHAAQVRGIDHAHRSRNGRTRPSCPVMSRRPSAS